MEIKGPSSSSSLIKHLFQQQNRGRPEPGFLNIFGLKFLGRNSLNIAQHSPKYLELAHNELKIVSKMFYKPDLRESYYGRPAFVVY